ncbi:MAG: GDSL-type esterase/lipase family protein [Lachnospiraceae bacterium]|nr:GDSL-type esterase/lipase family protein [Lachnospiraceae bacterium]MCM1229548.1 GDSL-type esterase/lipase family protein [Ruminococcus flavefaciens]
MKKFISAVLSASLAVSSMGMLYASAESYGDGSDIVLFGDSIAEGYDLGENEYNYGQIIADYIGGSVSNYAKAGDETADTIEKISSASDLADAEIVVISSGANDMIHYSTSFMLRLCAKMNALNDGYTADNLPEKPTFEQMMNIINTTALKNFLDNNVTGQMLLNSEILKLSAHLTMTEGDNGYEKYDRVIEAQIVPNIEQMVSDIRAVNPNARIIVQTLYNPLQLEQSYLDEKIPKSYKTFFETLKPIFNDAIDTYNEQISEIEGIEIADVYTDFKSDSGESGNTWYFTGFQESSVKEFKVHPNQAGHVAIAVNILNTLGEKREDGGLLNLTYEKLDGKDSYPAYALGEYNKVAGTYVLGDLDNNFRIDSNDATMILKEYSAVSTGKDSTLTESGKKASDVNGDTKIGSDDATVLLSYYSYCSTGGTSSLKGYIANK